MAQLKDTTVNGGLSVSGNITTDGAVNSNSLKVEGGSVEVYGTTSVPTPYIDFHYGGDTSDNTSRIIENASGELTINGVKTVGGVVHANNFVLPNGKSLKTYRTAGDDVSLIFLNNSDNLLVGGYTEGSHTGHSYVNSYYGHVYLRNKNRTLSWYADDSSTDYDASLRCTTDGKAACGSPSYKWYKLYATTTTIGTSDEREKSDITSISDYPVTYSADSEGNVLEQLFDRLDPKTYTLDAESTGEIRIGFVAQDIVKSLEELGLSEDDLGIIDHAYWTDEETGEEKDRYGLAYTEFIALNTYMIQKQKAKIKEQDERISDLEERLAKLEALIDA